MSQDVLLGDDAQETPEWTDKNVTDVHTCDLHTRVVFWLLPAPGDQTLAKAEFAEDVNYRFHGRVVGDSEWAEVQDASQLQRLWVAGRQLRGIFSEVDHRAADNAVLLLTCVFCGWTH